MMSRNPTSVGFLFETKRNLNPTLIRKKGEPKFSPRQHQTFSN